VTVDTIKAAQADSARAALSWLRGVWLPVLLRARILLGSMHGVGYALTVNNFAVCLRGQSTVSLGKEED
jgi:hypothetical protein